MQPRNCSSFQRRCTAAAKVKTSLLRLCWQTVASFCYGERIMVRLLMHLSSKC